MTEYDRIVSELRDKHMKQASEYIPKAYQALIAEGLSPMDARDRIEKDIGDIFSKSTIRRHMPEEAKHKEKAREQPKKQLIAATTSGQVMQEVSSDINNNNDIFAQDTAKIRPEQVYIPPNIFANDNIEVGPQTGELIINLKDYGNKLRGIIFSQADKAYLKYKGNEVIDVLGPKEHG